MTMKQPSFVFLLFLVLFLDVARAQTFERSLLRESSLKRKSRDRRRLHRHHAPRIHEDQGSRSHLPYHDGHQHGRKSDQSTGISRMSRKGLKGHSKSKNGPSLLPPMSDSFKSRKKGGPTSHSSKTKGNGGLPKARVEKS
jgi:hypothetical protein